MVTVAGDGSYTCEILNGSDAEYFKNELQPARKIYHVVGLIEGTNIVYNNDCPAKDIDAPEAIAAELTGEYIIYLDYDKFDDRYPKTIYFVKKESKDG